MKKLLTRRDAIKTGAASIYLLSPVAQAEAWILPVLQIVARIILGPAVRGAGARAVAGAVAGATIRQTVARTIAKRALLSTASLAINTGIIAAISEDVYALAKENNAKAIWVNDHDIIHSFDTVIYNQTDEVVGGNLYFSVKDIQNGNFEKEIPGAYFSLKPKVNFKDTNPVPGFLLRTGVKKIVGYSDNQYITCEESENIVVASSDEVEIS